MSYQPMTLKNSDLTSSPLSQMDSADFLETPALVAASFFVMALVLWVGPQGVVHGVDYVVNHLLAFV